MHRSGIKAIGKEHVVHLAPTRALTVLYREPAVKQIGMPDQNFSLPGQEGFGLEALLPYLSPPDGLEKPLRVRFSRNLLWSHTLRFSATIR